MAAPILHTSTKTKHPIFEKEGKNGPFLTCGVQINGEWCTCADEFKPKKGGSGYKPRAEDPLKTYQILCENAYTTAASLVLVGLTTPLSDAQIEAVAKSVARTGNFLAKSMQNQAKLLLAQATAPAVAEAVTPPAHVAG